MQPTLKLSAIVSGPNHRQYFDPQAMKELEAGIRAAGGVTQPILVRPHPEHEGVFEIMAGERRWRAAQEAGLETIPAIVRQTEDVDMLRDALLDSFIVHGDETEVQVLKEPGRKAQAKSYMWVQMTLCSGVQGAGPPIRLFGYAPSRSTAAAAGRAAASGRPAIKISTRVPKTKACCWCSGMCR